MPTPMRFCVILSALLAIPSLTAADGEIGDGEFKKLFKLLQPDPQESWRSIPWRIALLDAQEAAAREKKPIFIWAMDGHPLGCT